MARIFWHVSDKVPASSGCQLVILLSARLIEKHGRVVLSHPQLLTNMR